MDIHPSSQSDETIHFHQNKTNSNIHEDASDDLSNEQTGYENKDSTNTHVNTSNTPQSGDKSTSETATDNQQEAEMEANYDQSTTVDPNTISRNANEKNIRLNDNNHSGQFNDDKKMDIDVSDMNQVQSDTTRPVSDSSQKNVTHSNNNDDQINSSNPSSDNHPTQGQHDPHHPEPGDNSPIHDLEPFDPPSNPPPPGNPPSNPPPPVDPPLNPTPPVDPPSNPPPPVDPPLNPTPQVDPPSNPPPPGNPPSNPPPPVGPPPNPTPLVDPPYNLGSYLDKSWLDPQYHDGKNQSIKKPNELENEMDEPTGSIDEKLLDRIQGSIIGMAVGDALGAHVEFRPHQYLVDKPVTDLGSGGTWGLEKGQFTDDTSMALCLANSLIAHGYYNPYDQLVRYKWWYKLGYMSSTGQCFDIGAATRQSIQEFERRQKQCAKQFNIPFEQMDYLSDPEILKQFNVYCSENEVAGNGALMRLAPMPLFFYRDPVVAVELSGQSGQITHGDKKAYDACRYYAALIVAALNGYEKEQLLDRNFYSKHKEWFGENELHQDIKSIAEGSYQKNGYDAGIRGKGYIVNALEAALWAFWSDENSFEKGALAAVNLGDDTDTTAAIYGQLAGAHYGYKQLPEHWLKHVYAKRFMEKLSKWIAYEGECWYMRNEHSTSHL